MKKLIRIGVVGTGGIAQYTHIPGIVSCPDFQLTAVCDIDRDVLQRVGEQYGIAPACRFKNYEDLVASDMVDAVDVCTPNDVHYEVAMAAVGAKKPYACEKPVTMTADQAESLAESTREAGLKNMLCFSYRFKAAARFARDILQQGQLGELYHVSAVYYQAWGIPDAKTPLKWRFIKAHTGSGALGDLGSHALDLVRFITGKEYLNVISHAGTFVKERPMPDGSGMGKVDVDDYFNYMCEMEGGLAASFQISRFAYGRGNYQRIEIYGSKGALVYTLDEIPNADTLDVCIGQPMGDNHVFTRLHIPEKYRVAQMQSFADILLEKSDGLSAQIEDGRRNQQVIAALLQSQQEKRWVTL